jgi:hypothetical protein
MYEHVITYAVILRTDYPMTTVTENEYGKFISFVSYGAEIIYPQYPEYISFKQIG